MLILKKSADGKKGMQNYPVGKVLRMHILSEAIHVVSIVHSIGNIEFSMNHYIHNHYILL